jgi:hypothetical protein
MCLTVSGEEEGRCGVGVIHRGIPHGGTCPPGWGAHGKGQYPWPKGGEDCKNSGLDARLEAVVVSIQMEAVATTSMSAWLRETLPTASHVLDPYENPVTWWFDSWVRIWILNWIKKRILPVIHRDMGSSNRLVRWDVNHMGRGMRTAWLML